ncbi:MAG: response regulator transcription factor [Spirochaetaceae bacterium]|jgi:DNA-binding response OmpR family regulator|nr:response regulator transcription factor [Spirochaetaceae bacterium]
MNTIAVVDDEKNIREVIRIALEKEFRVEEYADGLAAWERFRLGLPDLIILDIIMPRMDGIELCKKIRTLEEGRSRVQTPVIFLSSRDEEIDKILGLESGGDDYVSKPFSLRELLARIRAGLRRSLARTESGGGILCGELLLDENRNIAIRKNRVIEFTVTEFRILSSLAAQPGYVKTREQLMAAAFPEDSFPNDRAADSHVKRIRKKFLDQDRDFAELESVYGLGYRWREPDRGNP